MHWNQEMKTCAEGGLLHTTLSLKLSLWLFLCWASRSIINYFLKGCQTSKCQLRWTAARFDRVKFPLHKVCCCNILKYSKWKYFLVHFMDKSNGHPIYECWITYYKTVDSQAFGPVHLMCWMGLGSELCAGQSSSSTLKIHFFISLVYCQHDNSPVHKLFPQSYLHTLNHFLTKTQMRIFMLLSCNQEALSIA